MKNVLLALVGAAYYSVLTVVGVSLGIVALFVLKHTTAIDTGDYAVIFIFTLLFIRAMDK